MPKGVHLQSWATPASREAGGARWVGGSAAGGADDEVGAHRGGCVAGVGRVVQVHD